MGKAEKLYDNREKVLEVAKKAKINKILFYENLTRFCQEEDDDFVYCFVDIQIEANKSVEETRYNSLKDFSDEIKKIEEINFELLATPLDVEQEHIQSIVDSQWKEECQAALDAAIPLEKIERNIPLLCQVESAFYGYKQKLKTSSIKFSKGEAGAAEKDEQARSPSEREEALTISFLFPTQKFEEKSGVISEESLLRTQKSNSEYDDSIATDIIASNPDLPDHIPFSAMRTELSYFSHNLKKRSTSEKSQIDAKKLRLEV
jgi:hypothetical protein